MYTVQLDFKINSLILWAFFQTLLQVLTQSVEILVNICCSGYSKVVHLQKTLSAYNTSKIYSV